MADGVKLPTQVAMTIYTFLALQIDKIKPKPILHSTGPKRPDLSITESKRAN